MPDFIEIDKKPVIFDDKDHCRTYTGKCDHFREVGMIRCSDENYRCSLFNLGSLKRSVPFYFVKKCQQCKAEWKKAKEKPLIDIKKGKIIGGAIIKADGTVEIVKGDNG